MATGWGEEKKNYSECPCGVEVPTSKIRTTNKGEISVSEVTVILLKV